MSESIGHTNVRRMCQVSRAVSNCILHCYFEPDERGEKGPLYGKNKLLSFLLTIPYEKPWFLCNFTENTVNYVTYVNDQKRKNDPSCDK